MQTITRSQVIKLRKDVELLLAKNGLQGYEFTVGNAKYTSSEATFQLKVKIQGQQTVTESLLFTMAKQHKINANKTLATGEKLVEFHSRKPKFPYISEMPNGKRYKMSIWQAQHKFAI